MDDDDNNRRDDDDYDYVLGGALLRAIEVSDMGEVKRVVNRRPSIVRENSWCSYPVFHALEATFWDAALYFVDLWPECLRRCDREERGKGKYPIHVALQCRAPVRVIRYMIRAFPGSLFLKDPRGRTPLMIAVVRGRYRRGGRTRRGRSADPPVLTGTATAGGERGRGGEAVGTERDDDDDEEEEAERIRPIETIELLIDSAPEMLREKDKYGNLPLHRAVYSLEVVRMVAAGYRDAVKTKNGRGKLPIHLALQRCVIDRDDREGDEGDGDNETRVVRTTVRILRFLIDAHPQSLSVPDGHGMIPLHTAVDSSLHVDIARCLISPSQSSATTTTTATSRADDILSIRNPRDGKIALHYAADPLHRRRGRHDGGAAGGEYAVLSLLLSSSSSSSPETVLRARDCSGRSPLHICRDAGRAAVVLKRWPESASLRDDGGNIPLHLASDGDATRTLLGVHPDGLRSFNDRGETPVHGAASGRFCPFPLDALREMKRVDPACLRYGCRRFGRTPIFYALERNISRDVLTYLLEDDPRCVDAVDRDGITPLHHLLENWDPNQVAVTAAAAAAADEIPLPDVLRLLLGSPGADDDDDGKNGGREVSAAPRTFLTRADRSRGQLPLHAACRNRHASTYGVIKLLLRAFPEGAEAADKYGNVPLFYLAERRPPRRRANRHYDDDRDGDDEVDVLNSIRLLLQHSIPLLFRGNNKNDCF